VPEVDAVVMPWREQVHYGTRRNGYHGGLTPQELFVPVVVVSADDLEGWTPSAVRRPGWWYHSTVRREGSAVVSPPTRPVAPSPVADAAPTLFDVEDRVDVTDAVASEKLTAAVPSWIADLLASAMFAGQRRNPRVRVSDDELERLLVAFDRMGVTTWPEPRLADEAGLPAARIGRYVAQLQDLLNVDGYPVVTVTDGAVRFDRALLARQFGL
jgi:hypothetical protein